MVNSTHFKKFETFYSLNTLVNLYQDFFNIKY